MDSGNQLSDSKMQTGTTATSSWEHDSSCFRATQHVIRVGALSHHLRKFDALAT